MYKGRSWLMWFVTFMMVCCFILQITALATVHWSVHRYQGHLRWRTEIGLFTYITNRDIMPPDGVLPVLYPVLAVVSVFILFVAIVVNYLYLATETYREKATVWIGVLSTLSGILLIITVIAWAVPHNAVLLTPSYSLGISGGIGGWGVVNGVLCLIDYIRIQRHHHEDYGHDGPEGYNTDPYDYRYVPQGYGQQGYAPQQYPQPGYAPQQGYAPRGQPPQPQPEYAPRGNVPQEQYPTKGGYGGEAQYRADPRMREI